MQDSGFQVLLQGNNFLRILQGLGVTMEFHHVSVLLNECIENLNIKPDVREGNYKGLYSFI